MNLPNDFLNINGFELRSKEAETVNAVLDMASGEMDEPGFSNWLKFLKNIFTSI